METLARIVGFIFSFKAYVMLPAIILVVALAIRMRVGQSLLSALRLGVGFAGIFIATALIAVYGIVVADWKAPLVEKECGLKGISITTLSINGLLPYGVAADRLIDRIPGLRRISLSPKGTGARFGFLVEPMMVGVGVGALFGVLAGYDIKRILESRRQRGGRDVHPSPLRGPHRQGDGAGSLQLKGIIQRRFPKKTVLYVGMDSGVIMGNSSVIVPTLPRSDRMGALPFAERPTNK